MSVPYKLRLENSEIPLNKPVFTIGSQRIFCDLFLDNPEIAPIHANVSMNDEGIWTIKDFNTKIGTKVNGAMIRPNIETELEEGDVIEIGDTSLIFINNIKILFTEEEVAQFNALFSHLQCSESREEIIQAGDQILKKLGLKANWVKKTAAKLAADLKEKQPEISALEEIVEATEKTDDKDSGEDDEDEPDVLSGEMNFSEQVEEAQEEEPDSAPTEDDEEEEEYEETEREVRSASARFNKFWESMFHTGHKSTPVMEEPSEPEEAEDEPASETSSSDSLSNRFITRIDTGHKEQGGSLRDRTEDVTEITRQVREEIGEDEAQPKARTEESVCILIPVDESLPVLKVTHSPYSIGREEECDYVLSARGISRIHARIYRENNGEFFLADHHSTNGTYLNGECIPEGAYLKPGDTISFYNVEFVVDKAGKQ